MLSASKKRDGPNLGTQNGATAQCGKKSEKNVSSDPEFSMESHGEYPHFKRHPPMFLDIYHG